MGPPRAHATASVGCGEEQPCHSQTANAPGPAEHHLAPGPAGCSARMRLAEKAGAVQYRLVSNYRDPKFLLGRIVDKLLCCVVLIILYNGLGKNAAPDNLINISSLLYMYTVLPGFAAISYMPGLVLERPLYIRCRLCRKAPSRLPL